MSDLARRLKKVEDRLHLGQEPNPHIMTVDNYPDSELVKSLPEDVTEWLTYKRKIRDYPDITSVLLLTSQELAARGLVADTLLPEPPAGNGFLPERNQQ